ncbi:Rha family transcriptional regulator [Ornithobacterium rhinotracheale]|uniref:Rha family transcriptional regulator n=1 Tax=Ornithobacterium rhinotracheale TaxID=28251 RepID=UPI003FA42DEB
MNNLSIKDTMSSREIAQIAGKNHRHLLRDIRKMEVAWEKVTETKFGLSEYTDSTGRKLPEYQLTKTECLYIATKFNDEARARLVLRWEALESEKQQVEVSKHNCRRKRVITNRVKEERMELVNLIRQYMRRGDMARTAKELGYNPSTVQDVMLGRIWNVRIVKSMHEKAVRNKAQFLFNIREMIGELK